MNSVVNFDNQSKQIMETQQCKVCGDLITIHIFGTPLDICWGCLSREERKKVVDINIKARQSAKIERTKQYKSNNKA